MAKETAHQLGTPISSLMGWLEHLRLQKENPSELGSLNISSEMEKDIQRLEKIAARFSQIGSPPELTTVNLNQVINEAVGYFQQRLPYAGSGVKIKENFSGDNQVPGNAELLSWVLENLLKNSLESVDPKDGIIEVSLLTNPRKKCALISVIDNGRGILPKDQKKIFSPGFTTKKRGWGLGLSLAKRIVEQYHQGKIHLAESVPGVRTEFRILLPLSA
jgi:hypothetical protein